VVVVIRFFPGRRILPRDLVDFGSSGLVFDFVVYITLSGIVVATGTVSVEVLVVVVANIFVVGRRFVV